MCGWGCCEYVCIVGWIPRWVFFLLPVKRKLEKHQRVRERGEEGETLSLGNDGGGVEESEGEESTNH